MVRVRRRESLVSILGTHYLQPIATLLERLLECPPQETGKVKTPYPENGYSAAICALAAVCFESCVMKLRFGHILHHDKSRRGGAIGYFKSRHPNCSDLDFLKDIFVLRNALAHNHVWAIDISWDKRFVTRVRRRVPAAFSGNREFSARVNMRSCRTNCLKLHVIPISVDRTDAYKTIRVVWKNLLYIDSLNLSTLGAEFLPLQFQGRKVRFAQIIAALPGAYPRMQRQPRIPGKRK